MESNILSDLKNQTFNKYKLLAINQTNIGKLSQIWQNIVIDNKKRSVHHISEWWSAIAIIFIFLLSWFSWHQINNLPPALTMKDEVNQPNSFNGERVWKNLQTFNSIGPRIVGSHENEVLAINFIKEEIVKIKKLAHPNQTVISDVQKVSGTYKFDPMESASMYHNVQNVVVKLLGKNEGVSKSALLLNCHFDTVHQSPGASDNAANCCIMLEILRILSKTPQLNQRSIIFLFNGAEESGLQGAHGFMTKHPWATDINAFLNMDSGGSNGKEILFQTATNSSWLLDIYKKTALHPFAQVSFEEIFVSGIVPSDTDYRVIREFGRIPGLDFAHPFNGYRYHTSEDSIHYLTMSVLQRTGDNMLGLTKGIVELDFDESKVPSGRSVYFDVLGFYFILYSENVGILINVTASILSIFLSYYFLCKSTTEMHKKYIRNEAFFGCLMQFLSFTISLGICCLIGYELLYSNTAMIWFNYTSLSLILYACPTLFIQCFLQLIKIRNDDKSPISISLQVQAQILGTCIFWSILMMALTVTGWRTGYILMCPLIIVTLSNVIIGLTGIQNSINNWIYIFIFGQIFVVLWTSYFYQLIIHFFIPLSGRTGAAVNPELTIGLITGTFTFLITSFMIPLVKLLTRTKHLLLGLLFVFTFTRIGVYFIDTPYHDGTLGYPTPQRHIVMHALRTIHDKNGSIEYTDSGYWFRELDVNARKTVKNIVAPKISILNENNPLCNKTIFCSIPFVSGRHMKSNGFWIPGPEPVIYKEMTVKLNHIKIINNYEKEISLNILIHNGMTAFKLRPKPNVKLIQWNLWPNVPKLVEWNNEKAYSVSMVQGIGSALVNATFHVKTDIPNYNDTLIDVSFFNFEYDNKYTKAFSLLLSKMPKWTNTISSVASVNTWVF